jgi:hypothetical protein
MNTIEFTLFLVPVALSGLAFGYVVGNMLNDWWNARFKHN